MSICQAQCQAQWREKPYICTLPAGHDGDVHKHSSRCSWSTTPDGGGWVYFGPSDYGTAKIELAEDK